MTAHVRVPYQDNKNIAEEFSDPPINEGPHTAKVNVPHGGGG